jgi:hypothetical protein
MLDQWNSATRQAQGKRTGVRRPEIEVALEPERIWLITRGAKTVSTTLRFGLALLLALGQGVLSTTTVEAACTGSTLPALAGNMAVNEWCQLATVNNSGLSDVMGDVGEGGYISEYANSAAWDPINEKFHFIGAHHGTTYIGRHVVYARATNAWTQSTWPGGCQSGTASSPCFNHAYDHNTVDPSTGDVYWRHYNDGRNVRRGTGQGTTWSMLPPIPAQQGQCCLVMKWFPERGGLVWVEPDWGAFLWTKATNTWTRIADTSQNETSLVDLSGMGVSNTSLTGMYSPTKRVMIVAGQTSVWKLDAAGAWAQLAAAPVALGTNRTSLAADPVSGDFVIMSNGSTTMRRLNPDGGGSWSTISANVPLALTELNGPGDGLVNAPITNYGVIMYVKYTGASTQTWLFKLSPSTIDQRTPTAPTSLSAG